MALILVYFIEQASELHHKTAREFFSDLHKNEKFIKKYTKQFFDEKNNQFLADRYISGECPKCGYLYTEISVKNVVVH